MANSPAPTIAYFTVVDDARTGWTGGLLLLNKSGRPLEFQCTLPVLPTRTHEILYGTTLRAHLVADVIGPVLIDKCRTPISILCCDQAESLALANNASFPIVLVREAWDRAMHQRQVQDGQAAPSEPTGLAITTGDGQLQSSSSIQDGCAHAALRTEEKDVSLANPAIARQDAAEWMQSMKTVLLSGSRLLVIENQLERVRNLALQVSELPDAVEPFERIREAIKEAQSQISRTPATRPAVA